MAAFCRAALAAGVHVGPPRQAAAVHGLGVRPGRRVVGRAEPGLVAARTREPRGRTAAGPRPERDLPGPARAVGPGLLARGVPLDRRERRGRERAVLPALRR